MSILTNEIPKHGKAKYIQGNFFSKKNNENYPYKSSYELAYLHQLESDTAVVNFLYEPFELYYNDVNGKQRIYRPDFMVLYGNGKIEIAEVKPKAMLKDFDVQSKARSCKLYLIENYVDVDINFKFITEQDLFNSDKEYQDFIKSIK